MVYPVHDDKDDQGYNESCRRTEQRPRLNGSFP